MLAPYIIIICLGLLFTFTFNVIFTSLSVIYCLIVTLANFVVVLGVDALFAFLIHSLPKKIFSPYIKIFKTTAGEHTFYEKIGILKWKEYVAELGGLGKFKKNKVARTDSEYLFRFLQENCCGEIIHYFCILAGFANLLFLNHYFLNFSLPIIIINAILNTPPIFIQRYNRPRLLRVYELKCRIEQRNKKSDEAVIEEAVI